MAPHILSGVSHLRDMIPPSSCADNFQDIGVVQRLDQVVALIWEQAEETAMIKQQLTSLKSEMEMKSLNAAQSSAISSSSSTTPQPVCKKLPTELLVRLISVYCLIIFVLWNYKKAVILIQAAVRMLHEKVMLPSISMEMSRKDYVSQFCMFNMLFLFMQLCQ